MESLLECLCGPHAASKKRRKSMLVVAFVVLHCLLQVTAAQPRSTVLITGASSGIGAVSAKFFASEGYNVVVCARRVERLDSLVTEIRTAGGQALALRCDVTDPKDVENAFSVAQQVYGSVDYVVANAGFVVILTEY